jgi:hypothetical protein
MNWTGGGLSRSTRSQTRAGNLKTRQKTHFARVRGQFPQTVTQRTSVDRADGQRHGTVVEDAKLSKDSLSSYPIPWRNSKLTYKTISSGNSILYKANTHQHRDENLGDQHKSFERHADKSSFELSASVTGDEVAFLQRLKSPVSHLCVSEVAGRAELTVTLLAARI